VKKSSYIFALIGLRSFLFCVYSNISFYPLTIFWRKFDTISMKIKLDYYYRSLLHYSRNQASNIKFKKFFFNNLSLSLSFSDAIVGQNNSTKLAITTFYGKLLSNLNKNKTTCSIFLDLQKAFDSVNHQILKKLYHYGFWGKIFNLLLSFVKGRKIQIKVNKTYLSHAP